MAYDPNDPRITAYVFGELAGEELAAFEAEFASSNELRGAVEQTRRTLDILSEDLAHDPPLALSDGQRQAVDQAIADSRPAGDSPFAAAPAKPGRRRVWPLLVAVVAVAAAVMILVPTLSRVPRRARSVAMQDERNAAEATAEYDQASSSLSSMPDDLQAYHDTYKTLPAEDAPTSEPASADPMSLAPSDAAAAVERYRQDQAKLEANNEALKQRLQAVQLAESSRAEIHAQRHAVDALNTELARKEASAALALDNRRSLARENLAAAEERERAARVEMIKMRQLDANEARFLLEQQVRPESLVDGESLRPDEGTGPGFGGDQFSPIYENAFLRVADEPLSTFSIDVDTASYAKVRMYLMQNNTLPRPDSVRIEELINYFTYDYEPPADGSPFAAHVEVADCPWTQGHRLVRVGIKGREIDNQQRPTSNLVFLLDVSGSMNRPNKLPLLKQGMKMLVDQLGENDRVAIVVYAGAAGRVLDSTTGDEKQVIIDALDRLHAGGSTNGGQGIQLAYQTALDHFVQGGVNRVILCTDGDFNVGVTGTDSLVRMAEDNAKTGVFLSVLGFGMGNHNDAMLEQISNKGNGNYAFIDTETEARKVLVEQLSGTLVTIAKDVKIQIEFNPAEVAAYRLIGYENRILAAEDFNDDTKDAGEIGAGHTVTALYEIVPAGLDSDALSTPAVDELHYQKAAKPTKEAESGELMLLKIRSKEPDAAESTKQEFHIVDEGKRFGQTDQDFRFAAAVASFGMLLRHSQYKGTVTYAGVQEIAAEAAQGDKSGYRQEFLNMVARARQLSGQ